MISLYLSSFTALVGDSRDIKSDPAPTIPKNVLVVENGLNWTYCEKGAG